MAPKSQIPTSDPEAGTSRKVLIVADERFRGGDLMKELRGHLNGRSATVEVFVIAPALADSAIQHELASFDEPIRHAQERLSAVLKELESVGIAAVGEVGDSDPVVAVGDGLREFPADEIIVVGHDREDRKYAEKNLWKRIENEFHPPVVALMVDAPDSDGRAASVHEIEREPAHVQTQQERIDSTRNFPPLRARDIAGMLIGFFGTFALALIAVDAGIQDDGNISGSSAAILLLAIGAFLLNIAHIVGLLFFQSVRYEGIWERFMARMSIIYTAGALVAAVIFWQVWSF